MPVTFHIESPYRSLFHDHGLGSFEALMRGQVGEMISCPGDRRKLYRFALPDREGRQHGFYLKRMTGEPVFLLLKSLSAGQRPHCGPIRELQLLLALRQAGFAAMQPVAWGEERRLAVPTGGFLAVAEVRGRDAAGLFTGASATQRNTLLGEIGLLVGKLHASGFFHPVRLKDLIRDESSQQLVLIDRETGKPWPRRFSRSAAIETLARTARRTLRDGHRFGPAGIGHFLAGYADGVAGQWPVSASELRRAAFSRLKSNLQGRG